MAMSLKSQKLLLALQPPLMQLLLVILAQECQERDKRLMVNGTLPIRLVVGSIYESRRWRKSAGRTI